MDFSETIAACDLKVGRCRQLIEIMKVKVISVPYIFQVLYVLCFTRARYQVSVYRNIGPLFLAHLSRRLKGELIVYQLSRRLCVCGHFQTQISPQPVGQS